MLAKSQIVAQEAPDADFNWIPASTYELLNNPEEIDSISITYKDSQLLEETKQQVRSIVALTHGLDSQDQSILNFSDYAKQQKTINTFFLGMQIFLGIIGVLNLLVAGVGIANATANHHVITASENHLFWYCIKVFTSESALIA